MRLRLTLGTDQRDTQIPINYQYPLSAAFYRIWERADTAYAAFLHDQGYGKGFKMFVFSDINCPFSIRGDRLILKSSELQIVICFHLPEAANSFIKGLFLNQKIDIADYKSRATFTVLRVESLTPALEQFENGELCQVVLKPVSPVVCGVKNEKGNYDFLSPTDSLFEKMIFKNWLEKSKSIYGDELAETMTQTAFVQTVFYNNPPKSRLITIKAGSRAQSKIRGFTNFKLILRGTKEAIVLLCNAGIGLYNAQGMGCVEMIEENQEQ